MKLEGAKRLLGMFVLLFLVGLSSPSEGAMYFNILHSFEGQPTDGQPSETNYLVQDGSYFYGSTTYGGENDIGTIFKISTDGGGYAMLHSFQDGSCHPVGSLTLYGAAFYGTTYSGGTQDLGMIFKINTDGTDFVILHSFDGNSGTNDGYEPFGGLTLSGSTLYGTTTTNYDVHSQYYRGAGKIFKINADGTGFAILHSFQDGSVADDGREPFGNLILYGSTLYGLDFGCVVKRPARKPIKSDGS